ncbi:hypothetical protein [Algibacter sp. 2305UL17-15]|uniref:hypothetical protein n=1 Tax=Algibacter sp. 2305UL17-15 TaxID=3231268 RepID=UPI00345A84FE
MKFKIALLAICGLVIATACKKKTAEKDNEVEITIVDTESKFQDSKNNSEGIKDCDDFLNTYESWADDLITLMGKHKDDPVALATSPEYINTMMKGVNFMGDWRTISVSCASSDSYAERMKAIQKKMEDKQKELGLKN